MAIVQYLEDLIDYYSQEEIRKRLGQYDKFILLGKSFNLWNDCERLKNVKMIYWGFYG